MNDIADRTSRVAAALLATALAAALLALAAGPAAATSPGQNGLLALNESENFEPVVRVIAPDGTGERILVRGGDLSWSPDATQVVYTDAQGGISIADADGQNARQIVAPVGDCQNCNQGPVWSSTGTIFLIRFDFPNDGLYRVQPDGSALELVSDEDMSGFDVSPDGTTIAFGAVEDRGDVGHAAIFLIDADGGNRRQLSAGIETVGQASQQNPSWAPDGQRLVFSYTEDRFDQNLAIVDLGGQQTLLTTGNTASSNPVWSPDGTLIAYVGFDGDVVFGEGEQGLYTIAPDGSGRTAVIPPSSDRFPSPTAWQPVVEGGPPPPPPPVEPLPQQDGLVDGGRVAGADAVNQAIATSQTLFGDGQATRVVLATSERFPDALAGAPLAGTQGPILFTPFADDLDPRVAEEITRVTGGNAQVLTLGGVAAVTEGAAAQARAAAGNAPCAAPLPSDCRFAGSGREETAALIAEVVQSEQGGTTALLARGDSFADAITGGAFAANGVPLLLTPPNQANQFTAAFLDAHPEITEIIVLGGTAAIDEATAQALGATDRVAGQERTQTSVEIAVQLWQASGRGDGGIVLVNVRDEDGWPAALAAAVASAVFDAPQIGVEGQGADLSQPVREFLAGVEGPIQAFGSPGQVTDGQLQQARAARDGG